MYSKGRSMNKRYMMVNAILHTLWNIYWSRLSKGKSANTSVMIASVLSCSDKSKHLFWKAPLFFWLDPSESVLYGACSYIDPGVICCLSLKNPNILQFVLQSENYSSAKLIIYSMNAMYKIPNDLSVGRPIWAFHRQIGIGVCSTICADMKTLILQNEQCRTYLHSCLLFI